MNLLLTNSCNKKCPYCFAKEKLVPEGSPRSCAITLKDLGKVINFLKRSNEVHLNIMGGEPTLHPEFQKAISMVMDSGLNLALFSNGLMSQDDALFLKGIEGEKCTVLLNINAPESYAGHEWAAVNRTMKVFNNKRVTLGFTIYRPDFTLDFVAELQKKYRLNNYIRVGLAAPVVGGRNVYVTPDDQPKVIDRLVRCIRRYRSAGIIFALDCGFSLCSFTDAQLKMFFRMGMPPVARCRSCIDVGPDLRVWRCFSTSLIWNKKLSDFKDLKEAVYFYDEKFKAFRRAGSRSGCLACEQLKTGLCSGGCLGHILRGFHVEDKWGARGDNGEPRRKITEK